MANYSATSGICAPLSVLEQDNVVTNEKGSISITIGGDVFTGDYKEAVIYPGGGYLFYNISVDNNNFSNGTSWVRNCTFTSGGMLSAHNNGIYNVADSLFLDGSAIRVREA